MQDEHVVDPQPARPTPSPVRPVSRQVSAVNRRPITDGFGTRTVPQRRRRSSATWVLILIGLAVLLAGGYLLLMRHVDPATARREIIGELRSLPLEPGERVERIAYIYKRSPWDYFRSSHGVLAATDRRLLVLTMAPTDRFAREVERPVMERAEFPKDTTLHMSLTRVNLGLAGGVKLRAPGARASYGVFSDDRALLQALMANVKHRQDSIYAAASEAKRQRELLAEVMRRPIWYRVRPGDAVTSIAQRFNTTPELLRSINNLASDRIRVGDSIMVKGPTR